MPRTRDVSRSRTQLVFQFRLVLQISGYFEANQNFAMAGKVMLHTGNYSKAVKLLLQSTDKDAVELAIELLKQSTDVIAISSMYETAPVGGPEQENYINAVVTLESELPAADLLALLHGIEKSMGRVRDERWGPRVIDLDLIQYGTLLSRSEELTLPHPRAHERRFVLEPWHEIDAEAILLTHGRIDQLLEHLPPSL